jgi:hypothetical protein
MARRWFCAKSHCPFKHRGQEMFQPLGESWLPLGRKRACVASGASQRGMVAASAGSARCALGRNPRWVVLFQDSGHGLQAPGRPPARSVGSMIQGSSNPA